MSSYLLDERLCSIRKEVSHYDILGIFSKQWTERFNPNGRSWILMCEDVARSFLIFVPQHFFPVLATSGGSLSLGASYVMWQGWCLAIKKSLWYVKASHECTDTTNNFLQSKRPKIPQSTKKHTFCQRTILNAPQTKGCQQLVQKNGTRLQRTAEDRNLPPSRKGCMLLARSTPHSNNVNQKARTEEFRAGRRANNQQKGTTQQPANSK